MRRHRSHYHVIGMNDLSAVSKANLNIMFADDTNILMADNDITAVRNQLHDDLAHDELNVTKTHHMVFPNKRKISKTLTLKSTTSVLKEYITLKFLMFHLMSNCPTGMIILNTKASN